MNDSLHAPSLRKVRIALGIFLAGLILGGVTAFPLVSELRLLSMWLGAEGGSGTYPADSLQQWIATVREGLEETGRKYPFMAYGTDWLAFGHLMIAVFFIGPWLDPRRNIFIIKAGLFACAAVIPLAFICGEVRGIPIYWRLIDCSFGIFGAIPLLYCLRVLRNDDKAMVNPS